MTNLKEFCENKNFSTGESLPEGDTYINVDAEVKETEQEWEGKKRIRYQIKDKDTTYFVGPKVMDGIKSAIKKGFSKVRVTRTGEGKNTTYTVVGVKEWIILGLTKVEKKNEQSIGNNTCSNTQTTEMTLMKNYGYDSMGFPKTRKTDKDGFTWHQ